MSSAHKYRIGRAQPFLKGVQLRATDGRDWGSQRMLAPIPKGPNIMDVR